MPYARMIVEAVIFALIMTALTLFGETAGLRAPRWDASLALTFGAWLLTGLGVAYARERAETYLDRKNERWRRRGRKER